MRAIFIFLMFVILVLSGCASIEVAKEVTKATKSIKSSIKNMTNPKKENTVEVTSMEENTVEVTSVEENTVEVTSVEENNKKEILNEKQKISKNKQITNKIVSKQKKVATINLLGKTLKELNGIIGQPQLIREDRKTTIARYDSKNCRIFIFMRSKIQIPRVEYYELRNEKGGLIDRQKDIEKCFQEVRPI